MSWLIQLRKDAISQTFLIIIIGILSSHTCRDILITGGLTSSVKGEREKIRKGGVVPWLGFDRQALLSVSRELGGGGGGGGEPGSNNVHATTRIWPWKSLAFPEVCHPSTHVLPPPSYSLCPFPTDLVMPVPLSQIAPKTPRECRAAANLRNPNCFLVTM